MKYIPSGFTIVILASANNPSILNPDFLRINEIISKEYTPLEFITTPAISLVKYKEKISISVDSAQLTFVDAEENRIPLGSPIPAIAERYIEVLRHVPYNAVGINFNGYYECSHIAPNQYVFDKFIKKGPWEIYEGSAPSIGLSFSYEMDEITLNLNVAPAVTKKGEKILQNIAINSNFHYAPKEEKTKNILDCIKTWQIRYTQLNNLLSQFFPDKT